MTDTGTDTTAAAAAAAAAAATDEDTTTTTTTTTKTKTKTKTTTTTITMTATAVLITQTPTPTKIVLDAHEAVEQELDPDPLVLAEHAREHRVHDNLPPALRLATVCTCAVPPTPPLGSWVRAPPRPPEVAHPWTPVHALPRLIRGRRPQHQAMHGSVTWIFGGHRQGRILAPRQPSRCHRFKAVQ